MTKAFQFLAPIVVATACFLGQPTASAQTYRLTDLGVPAGRQIAHPAAVNNQGWVAGGSDYFAFRYVNGVMQELGTLPGGTVSAGSAINDSGDVAGSSTFENSGNIRHATLFNVNGVFDLGTLPNGNYSVATGLNNFGQVVGYAGPTGSTSNTRAFIWDSGNGIRDIGTLGGQYARALSINGSGIVTGDSQIPTGFGAFHAFIWDAINGMHDIGTIAGDSSKGTFVNAKGHIVGGSTINNFDNRNHAFLWDGTMHDLGSLGTGAFESDRSSASGVNQFDQVVGSSFRPYTGGALYQTAFVYRSGRMFDLEKLVDASAADYRLYTAVAINDDGKIAVDAIKVSTNQIHPVLLTPNPTAFDFTIVADSTTSGFSNAGFGAYPTINDSEAVAFYAELTPGVGSVYKANANAAPILIGHEGNGAPSINNRGEVASARSFGGAQTELYKSVDGVTSQQIAFTGTEFRSFPGYTYLGNNGTAVFYANRYPVSPTRRGIYTGNGDGTTNLVVDNAGPFGNFGANPGLNDAGTVAFAGNLDVPVGGIYTGTTAGNGVTTPVITNETAPLYNFDGAPFINNSGQIAFLAQEQATFAPAVWLINQDGTGLRKVADVSGPYSQLRSPVVNDSGTFVFFAFLDSGGRGIFTGPNAGSDKVVATGDPLFGSTVESLAFFRGLNNKDEIAFFYTLTDERSGIARAKLATSANLKPRIISCDYTSGNPRISFSTLADHIYRLEYKHNLTDSAWSTVTGAESVRGTGGTVQVVDYDPSVKYSSSCYYRAVLIQ